MRTLCLSLALLAVACQKAPSKLDEVSKSDGVTSAAAGGAVSGDVEARLAKVERKLGKVVEVLEQAMGGGEPDPSATYSVAVDPIDPVEGPADAKVTIIEGFEFLCPYCAMVNPTMEAIREKYPNDVRIVSKYLVIHGQPALPPAMMACAAAKQGKYSAVKNAFWNAFFKIENGRPSMNQDQINPENMKTLVQNAGVDMAKLEGDMKECQKWISSSQQALQPVGANGTPAFFVNGRFVNGAQPLPAFEKLIQEEIAKADKAIADGVPKADFYNREIVAKGERRVKSKFED